MYRRVMARLFHEDVGAAVDVEDHALPAKCSRRRLKPAPPTFDNSSGEVVENLWINCALNAFLSTRIGACSSSKLAAIGR